jgi:hypothetical protein
MAEEFSDVSEIQSEITEMSSVAEASALLRSFVGDAPAGTKVKSLITSAAKAAGWTVTRAKDVWYGDARRIEAHEMDRLRSVAAKLEVDRTVNRLLVLRDGLAKTDPDFHRQTIDALERALRGMGREVEPVGFRQQRRTVKHHNAYRGA